MAAYNLNPRFGDIQCIRQKLNELLVDPPFFGNPLDPDAEDPLSPADDLIFGGVRSDFDYKIFFINNYLPPKMAHMFYKILSGSLLIAGTTIGAGMLGIPLLTAGAGFWPAIFITGAVWLFMLATGLLYLEATLWMEEGANILSISRRFLGKSGRWAAGSTFLFLYYCLMIAYFAAGAPILLSFLGLPLTQLGYLGFGALFGMITAFGIKTIDRINYILMFAMFIAYFALLVDGSSLVERERLSMQNWPNMVFAAPVLFSAFGFHNVIPSLTTYFHRNVKVLRRSIFFGTFIPFIIYVLWQWLIIGAVPQSSIELALIEGRPATAALQSLTGSPWILRTGQFFALFAIATSMLGVAFSMVDFLGDGLKIGRRGFSRIFLCLLVFLPPYLLSTINPEIFITALGIAGGFGEAFLNGMLPVMLVWVGRYTRELGGKEMLFGKKGILSLLFALALCVMGLEAILLFR